MPLSIPPAGFGKIRQREKTMGPLVHHLLSKPGEGTDNLSKSTRPPWRLGLATQTTLKRTPFFLPHFLQSESHKSVIRSNRGRTYKEFGRQQRMLRSTA